MAVDTKLEIDLDVDAEVISDQEVEPLNRTSFR